jgi:hypothetical protein
MSSLQFSTLTITVRVPNLTALRQVKVMLRRSVSQLCLGVKFTLELVTRVVPPNIYLALLGGHLWIPLTGEHGGVGSLHMYTLFII